MSIQNTQTRRTAPLAGDGNGNPSPRAVPDRSRATPELLGAPNPPGERDTCGRASSNPLGRLSIQTHGRHSPAVAGEPGSSLPGANGARAADPEARPHPETRPLSPASCGGRMAGAGAKIAAPADLSDADLAAARAFVATNPQRRSTVERVAEVVLAARAASSMRQVKLACGAKATAARVILAHVDPDTLARLDAAGAVLSSAALDRHERARELRGAAPKAAPQEIAGRRKTPALWAVARMPAVLARCAVPPRTEAEARLAIGTFGSEMVPPSGDAAVRAALKMAGAHV